MIGFFSWVNAKHNATLVGVIYFVKHESKRTSEEQQAKIAFSRNVETVLKMVSVSAKFPHEVRKNVKGRHKV